jgi:MSHA biogenesis protein MshM
MEREMNSLTLMYESHFGFHQHPFSLTPNTKFFLNSASHHRALQTLVVALDGLEGFIKIIGEVGTGKTLLCRKLMSSLDERYVTALVMNPMLEPVDFYRAFADEIGIELDPLAGTHQILKSINGRLIENAGQGKRVLLIIDEAQTMPLATIEALRLLTNLETESSKLLQVVLFGQPELNNLMDTQGLRQLKQRITFQDELDPLDRDGVDCYIRHRLQVAGFAGPALFRRNAVGLIHRRSGGIPRLVNIISHKALLAAFGYGDRLVCRKHVKLAVADTESTRTRRTQRMWSPWRTS